MNHMASDATKAVYELITNQVIYTIGDIQRALPNLNKEEIEEAIEELETHDVIILPNNNRVIVIESLN